MLRDRFHVMNSPFFRATAAGTQQLRQFATGAKQQHPDAPFSKTKRGRYLSMVSTFDVGQPHQLALLRREPLEHTRHVETERNIRFWRTACVRRLVSTSDFMPPAPKVIDDQAACHAKEECAQLLRVVT